MKALFDFIKARINTSVPAIKTVRLWNAQTDREKSVKDEKPWRSPAVFVEILPDGEIQSFSFGIKNVPLIIRFRFAKERYKFERLDDLDFQDAFDKFIHTFRGNESDPVQFTTLQEANTQLDADFDMLNEPFIDYKTIWRKKSAYTRATNIVSAAPLSQTINPEILN